MITASNQLQLNNKSGLMPIESIGFRVRRSGVRIASGAPAFLTFLENVTTRILPLLAPFRGLFGRNLTDKVCILIIATGASGCATKSTDYLLLDAVNREVNQVQYKMTPAKSLDDFYANGGNCRNFAEAKYSKLLDAGFTDDAMRFTYFWHKGGNQFHTTLEVQADDTVYVLDNMYSWLSEADGYYNMKVHRASYAEAKNSIWWGK